MNPLERSLIEKTGYDNGWENVLDDASDAVLLGSSRHSGQAQILCHAGDDGYRVHVTPFSLAVGLRHQLEDLGFTVPNSESSFWLLPDRATLASFLRRSARVAQALPDQPEKVFAKEMEIALAEIVGNRTEVERIVRQRVGQNIYRKAQLDYWGGRCAVTGLDLPEVLRASHSKPWADCQSDSERLDVFNGFLLAPDLDALFDRGLITFDNDGAMLVSPKVGIPQLTALRMPDFNNLRLRWITPNHLPYLVWHRDRVFTD
jgi:predicted restriction endonuclease